MRPRQLRRRLALVGLGGVLALATAVVQANQAHATPLSFVQSLNDHGIVVYDATAAVTTGIRVCAMLSVANGDDVTRWVFTHSSWSDVPDMTTAATWVIVSVEELCPAQDHRGQNERV